MRATFEPVLWIKLTCYAWHFYWTRQVTGWHCFRSRQNTNKNLTYLWSWCRPKHFWLCQMLPATTLQFSFLKDYEIFFKSSQKKLGWVKVEKRYSELSVRQQKCQMLPYIINWTWLSSWTCLKHMTHLLSGCVWCCLQENGNKIYCFLGRPIHFQFNIGAKTPLPGAEFKIWPLKSAPEVTYLGNKF